LLVLNNIIFFKKVVNFLLLKIYIIMKNNLLTLLLIFVFVLFIQAVNAQCPPNIDDGNPCTRDLCNTITFVVTHTPLTNTGGGQSDNDLCTRDNCSSGITVHPSVNTNDNNVCTTDGCISTTGVFHTRLTNTGGGANDNNQCTSDDCVNGITLHPAVIIDDNNPCTADLCISSTGISHTPLTNIGGGASDNDPCTSDDCVSGITIHGAPGGIVNDNNPCTLDGCNSTHTPLTNIGGGATDNNACTADDCTSGVTVHTNLSTSDNEPCTIDGCLSLTGIFHNPITNNGGGASDNNPCTSDDCLSGLTIHPSINIDDNNPCTADACITTNGSVFHTPQTNIGGGASDNNLCTSDNCSIGTTVYFNLPTNDNEPCTTDGCISSSGIFHTPLTNSLGGASDNNLCTTDDCLSGLTIHPSVNIDDNNPCTADGCITTSGSVFHTPQTNTGGGASDNNLCTSDNCSGGTTVYSNLPTNDNEPCTTDGCISSTGIFHDPLTNSLGGASDNNLCTVDDCLSGLTIHTVISTNDNNPCTTDGCDSNSGPFHTPLTNIGGGANDNDVCTSDDCSSGISVHLGGGIENDNNPCTSDGCNSVHIPITNAGGGETDNDLCTADNCLNGITVHPFFPTNDNNPCTEDGCISSSGIFHSPLNSGNGANDNNECTSDICVSGLTVHVPVSVDDNDLCTFDECNTVTGSISHSPPVGFPANAGPISGPGYFSGTFPGTVSITTCTPGSYTFCVPPVANATSYYWYLDHTSAPSLSFSNVSIITTYTSISNCITIFIPDGYNSGAELEVMGVNCNGQGLESEVNILLQSTDDHEPCTIDACNSSTGIITHTPIAGPQSPPATPGQISGSGTISGSLPGTITISVCSPGTYQFCIPAVPFATSYTWFIDRTASPGITFASNGLTILTTTFTCVDITIPPGYSGTPQELEVLSNNCHGSNGTTSEVDIRLLSADDNNLCTVDACNSTTGVATNTPLPNDDNNKCTFDGCISSTGIFYHTPLTNTGGGASDDNFCTSDDCLSGVSVYHVLSINDNEPCTTDGCNSAIGGVFHTPLTNSGGGASDNNLCTLDNCSSGVTVHSAISTINDNNPCTVDGCISSTGSVTHAPLTNKDGGASDNNPCTADNCSSGITVHPAASTNDNEPCTTDGCNTTIGIFHTPLTNTGGGASDNNPCTTDNCLSGQTVHLPPAPGNPPATPGPITGPGSITGAYPGSVTLTVCSPGTYRYCIPSVPNATNYHWFIDHNAVPGISFAINGLTALTTTLLCIDIVIPSGYNGAPQELEVLSYNCNGTNNNTSEINIGLVSSNDNNPCTTDACNTLTGIGSHVSLTNTGGGANDNNLCTQDNCANGLTVYVPKPTNDNNACTYDGCTPSTGVVFHTPLTNSGGGPSDNNPCTDDNCANGIAVHPTTNSNDNNPCTTDGCNQTNGVFHTPLTNTGGGANDNNVCTQDNCANGGTVHIGVNTNDNNPCTADGCDRITGVYHTPLTNTGGGASDNNPCTSDNCTNGATVHTAANLNDNNPCTTDGCNTITGIIHTPLTSTGGGSTDNNVCTDDNCANGVTAHIAISTNDNNPCTTDGCNPTTGVFHTPKTNNGGGENDNNVCTQDNCVTGVTVHPPTNTSDNNPCTTDGCVSTTGIFHTPVTNAGSGASDNNLCTNDNCLSGQTVHPPIAGIDDNDPCTLDACNPQTASITHGPGGIGPQPATPGQVTSPSGINSGNNLKFCSPGTYQVCVPTITNASSYYWWIDHTANPSLSFSNVSVVTTYTSTTNCITIYVPVGYNSNQELEIKGVNICGHAGHQNEVDIKIQSPDDNNPCTTDACNTSNGAAIHTPVANGSPGASDHNPCTNDVCQSGQTVHIQLPGSATVPLTAGPITGPGSFSGSLPWNGSLTVCSSGTYQYCVPPITGATSYRWNFTHISNPPLTFALGIGATIITTYNCVDVIIPPGYNPNHPMELEVRGMNCKGLGHHSEIGIKLVNILALPGNINGPSSACKSSTQTYSIPVVPGATSYLWTITGGALIAGGQGTTSVQVNFTGASSNSAVLSVYATSTTCSNSPTRTKNINVILTCKVSNPSIMEQEVSGINEIFVYPNPTSGKVTLSVNSTINEKYNLKVLDIIGKVVFNEDVTFMEGQNTKEIILEKVSNGIYFLSILSEGMEAKTIRIVVEY
jgi:hypothetical protein